MNLSAFQSLSPEKQRLVFIVGGVVSFLGLIALFAGFFFNPTQQSQQVQTNQRTETKKDAIDKQSSPSSEPSSSPLASSSTSSSSPSEYPTPYPTIDYTLQYFISAIPTTPPPTPTPTHLPGNFYTPNGKQNDLEITVAQNHNWDITVQIQLINTKTKEKRVIGKGSNTTPGKSAFFSPNFSSVIFAGGKPDGNETEAISFYSIPLNKITKQITLANIKKALPSITIDPLSVIGRLMPSPNGQKIAFSYGRTYTDLQIDPNTAIIVIELNTNRMHLLPVKGLMKTWKDDTTIEYEPSPGATQEFKL